MKEVQIVWGGESSIVLTNSSKPVPYVTSNDLIRILEATFNKSVLPLQKVTMNHWLSFSLILEDEIPKSIKYLDRTLGPITYLVGESISVSDLAVFSALYGRCFHYYYKDIEAVYLNIYFHDINKTLSLIFICFVK